MSLLPYYKILGLSPGATQKDIKKAFRRKAMLTHPDRNPNPGATENFHKLNVAYEVLIGERQPVVVNSTHNRKKSTKYSQKEKEQSDREKKKEKVKEYYRKKEEAYRKSPQFKKDLAIGILLDHLGYFTGLFVLLCVPFLFFGGLQGIIISVCLIVMSSPFWYQAIVLKKKTIHLKNFKLAFKYIYHNTDFKYYLFSLVNLICFLNIVLNTFVYTSLIIVLIIAPFVIYMLKCKLKKTKISKKKLNLFVLIYPGIVNLFFLINFTFSTPLKPEIYRLNKFIKYEESFYTHFEHKQYDNYKGLRLFINYDKGSGMYMRLNVEQGLFNLKVLKSYSFMDRYKYKKR